MFTMNLKTVSVYIYVYKPPVNEDINKLVAEAMA